MQQSFDSFMLVADNIRTHAVEKLVTILQDNIFKQILGD